MVPTNNRLNQINDGIREARAARKLSSNEKDTLPLDLLSTKQQSEAVDLMQKWSDFHRVRIILNSIGWTLGLLALAAI